MISSSARVNVDLRPCPIPGALYLRCLDPFKPPILLWVWAWYSGRHRAQAWATTLTEDGMTWGPLSVVQWVDSHWTRIA